MNGKVETVILKAHRGTDPEFPGDKVVMFSLHDDTTDELRACVCLTDCQETEFLYAHPEVFKAAWAMGKLQLGMPKPVAFDFLEQPGIELLWSEPVTAEHIPGSQGRQSTDTLH